MLGIGVTRERASRLASVTVQSVVASEMAYVRAGDRVRGGLSDKRGRRLCAATARCCTLAGSTYEMRRFSIPSRLHLHCLRTPF